MSLQTTSTLTGIRYKTDIEKWEARLSLQGKSYSKTFLTVDEAIEWRKGMQEPKTLKTLLTCEDLFPKWLESLKNDDELSLQTYLRYASDVKVYLLPFFGKQKIKEINDELVLKFAVSLKEFKRMKKSLAAKTIKNIIGALSNFFEYCCVRNYITFNPVGSSLFRQNLARLVKERRKSDRGIKEKARTIDELQALLVAAYQRDYELGLVIEFMISTGLRLGEVSALTWQDLQRSTNTSTGGIVWFILVNKTRYPHNKMVQMHAKSGSNGAIPISPALVEKLEQWKVQAEQLGHDILSDNVVFPAIARNQKGFTKTLVVLSEKLGIRKTTAHCLRHSSVTFLASNGHDLQSVQKFARHSSVNMTRAYFAASHLNMEGMANTMNKLFIPTEKLG